MGVSNMQTTINKSVCIDSCTVKKVGGKLGKLTKKHHILTNEEERNWTQIQGKEFFNINLQ